MELLRELHSLIEGKLKFSVDTVDHGGPKEGDIMVLVVSNPTDDSYYKGVEYYGVNVVFSPDGKVELVTADPLSKKEAGAYREEIIKAARKGLPKNFGKKVKEDVEAAAEVSAEGEDVLKALCSLYLKDFLHDSKTHSATAALKYLMSYATERQKKVLSKEERDLVLDWVENEIDNIG